MAREYIPVAVERLVRQRAHERCEYCQSPSSVASAPFTLEHIHPIALGGTSEAGNLALACAFCNLSKGDKIDALDYETSIRVPLFHPRQQRWSEHFSWSEDFLSIVPHTPIARVTVSILNLNRAQLQNLRRVLVRSEQHPPDRG